jgi:hypothetical protein
VFTFIPEGVIRSEILDRTSEGLRECLKDTLQTHAPTTVKLSQPVPEDPDWRERKSDYLVNLI